MHLVDPHMKKIMDINYKEKPVNKIGNRSDH